MDIRQIIELCLVILCAVGFGVLLYYKVRGNIIAAVGELIALAEATGKTGAEKMAQVVAGLSKIIPAPLKSIFTEDRLEAIAQNVFDWMKKYANEYTQKLESVNSGENTEEVIDAFNKEAAVEVISDLLNMPLGALKEKALEYGVVVDSLTTRKAVAQAIVNAILSKA